MTRLRTAVFTAFVLLLSSVSPPASAIDIWGTFAGIANARIIYPDPFNSTEHPLSYYEGAPLTGMFRVVIPDEALEGRQAPADLEPHSLLLTFDIKDMHFAFDLTDSGRATALTATPEEPVQRLNFINSLSRFHHASVGLLSESGTLFDPLDLTTLRVTGDSVTGLRAGFSDFDENLVVTVDVSAFRIGAGPVPPVPDAAAPLLMGLGVAALAWRMGSRRAQRPVDSPRLHRGPASVCAHSA